MRTTLTAATAATAAAVVALVAPAAASADTIAYVTGGDAHLIRADGSGDRAITTGGTTTSVAWAPDGTLWAGKDRRLVHLTATGQVLGDVGVPDIEFVEDPAFDIDVSPDGTKLALTQIGATCDSGCSRPQASMVVDAATGALVGQAWSAADNLTWIGPAQLFGTGGAGADFSRFLTDGTGNVFFNSGSADTADVTIAPDHRAVAWVGYLPGSGFAVLSGSTDADPASSETGSVSAACGFAPLLDEYRADPEFSPDSTRLAYSGPQGIQIADRPVRGSDAECGAVAERTIAGPGASSMSWSTATLPDAAPAPGTATATVLRRSRTRGVTVRVAGLPDGRASAAMLLKGKVVGTRRATVRAGAAKVTVKPAKRFRRALRRATSVVVRVTPGTGAPMSVTVRF